MISTVAWFVIGLLAFLFGFGFFIGFVARRLKDKVPRRLYSLIEGLIIGGIVLGILGMFQPWVLWGFRIGFNVLFFSTLAYIVWSHVTPRSEHYEEADVVSVPPLYGEHRETNLSDGQHPV